MQMTGHSFGILQRIQLLSAPLTKLRSNRPKKVLSLLYFLFVIFKVFNSGADGTGILQELIEFEKNQQRLVFNFSYYKSMYSVIKHVEISITLFSLLQPPLTLWRRGQSRQSYHLSSTFNRLLLATLLRIDLFWPFSQKQQPIATMDFWFSLNLWPLQHNFFAYFVRLSLKKSATGCQKNLWMQNFQGQKRLWYKG